MTAKQSIALVVGVIFMVITAVLAEDLGVNTLELSWNTIDSGGGSSSGGSFDLTGTIGQAEASPIVMSGGDLTIAGGFWAGAGPATSTCPADLNYDGLINVNDLLAVINAWGPCICPADTNSDGVVNVDDLLTVIHGWGACP